MIKAFVSLMFFSILLTGCSDQTPYHPKFSNSPNITKSIITFGVHPLHNPALLHERYGPVIDFLNQHIPDTRFQLETSNSYEEFDAKLFSGKFAFALPNPYQTLMSLDKNYHVFAKMSNDDTFRGILITRKDKNITSLSDLIGGKVSYPARSALAATMLPQYFLQTHGIQVTKDISNIYVGSQESSIMSVYLGNSIAAATWPMPWSSFQIEHPDIAKQLEVKWETSSLINNGLVVRNDIPDMLVQKVSRILITMHKNTAGQKILKSIPLSRFDSANNDSYQVVKDFMSNYKREIPLQP